MAIFEPFLPRLLERVAELSRAERDNSAAFPPWKDVVIRPEGGESRARRSFDPAC